MSSSSSTSPSPSASRRQALKTADACNQLRVLDNYPLHKYMDIADRLLERFQTAIDQRHLDDAYVYGHRFALFAVERLPQHQEWKRSQNHNNNNNNGVPSVDAKRKKRLNAQVEKVLSMMEVVVQRMDAEELIKERQRRKQLEEEEALERDRVDSQRRKEKEQRDALEEERQKFLSDQKKIDLENKKKHIEQSAMAKLYALNAAASVNTKSKAAATATTTTITAPKTTTKTTTTTTTQKGADATRVTPVHATKQPQAITTTNSNERKEKPVASFRQASVRNDKSDKSNSVHTSQPTKTAENMRHPKKKSTSSSRPNEPKESKVAKNVKPTPQPKAETPAPDLHQNSKAHSNHTDDAKSHVTTKTKKKDNKPTSASVVVAINTDETDQILQTTDSHKQQQMIPDQQVNKVEDTMTNTTSTRKIGTVVLSEKRPGEIETQLRDNEPSSDLDTNLGKPIILSPWSTKEQRTIELLQKNIEVQERRLEDIEENQIPYLLSAAKQHLKENNKKEALKCVAHKKRLEQQVDVIKGAIFNMETQMFMLENAMEDRHVKRALDEAASALSGLQQAIGDPDATRIDLTNMNMNLSTEDVTLDDTDEELMEELEDWVAPNKRGKGRPEENENISILSLPSVPSTTPLPNGSVRQILSAVLGS